MHDCPSSSVIFMINALPILLTVCPHSSCGSAALFFLFMLIHILSKSLAQELTGTCTLSSVTVLNPGTILLSLYFLLPKTWNLSSLTPLIYGTNSFSYDLDSFSPNTDKFCNSLPFFVLPHSYDIDCSKLGVSGHSSNFPAPFYGGGVTGTLIYLFIYSSIKVYGG